MSLNLSIKLSLVSSVQLEARSCSELSYPPPLRLCARSSKAARLLQCLEQTGASTPPMSVIVVPESITMIATTTTSIVPLVRLGRQVVLWLRLLVFCGLPAAHHHHHR